jgi:hypothetical protein
VHCCFADIAFLPGATCRSPNARSDAPAHATHGCCTAPVGTTVPFGLRRGGAGAVWGHAHALVCPPPASARPLASQLKEAPSLWLHRHVSTLQNEALWACQHPKRTKRGLIFEYRCAHARSRMRTLTHSHAHAHAHAHTRWRRTQDSRLRTAFEMLNDGLNAQDAKIQERILTRVREES